MTAIDTVVIGAGHAGLAVSHLLGKVGRDHVVLDRGRVAESWRSERWDSLRLLTPRWMTRLPGWQYSGADQEGFMGVRELVDHLEGYAAASGAPARVGGQEVLEVSQSRGRYLVTTTAGRGSPRTSSWPPGPTGRPHRPEGIDRLGADIAGAVVVAVPQPAPARRRAACSSSAPPRRARRSPTSWPGRAGASCWPSAATTGCRAATGGWTSSGGSSRPADWPGVGDGRAHRPATPAASRRSSWRAGRQNDHRGPTST